MTELHTNTECFFNSRSEEEFLYSLLKPDMDVLEYGAGRSSLAIAPRVKSLVSIEHLQDWHDEIKPQLPANATIHHVRKNQEEADGHDGTLADFRRYIQFPRQLNRKWDIIFVDGRARVECCNVAMTLLKDENSFILVHDIFNEDAKCDREEYWEILKFLHPVKGEYSLWMFKPKRNL